MATLPLKQSPTLMDWAVTLDPSGKTAKVAELLNQSNEILQYIVFKEGNLPTGHKSTVRTSLPTIALRSFYKGVKVGKSGRATVEDVCAMAEGRNEVDKDLAELNGNVNDFRLSEGAAFIEAMNQTLAQQLIYGDPSVDPEGILGLAPRYNTVSGTTGQQVIDAGGTGVDNTSVYLVVFGENTVSGIFPKGSMAGLVHENLGVIDAVDENNDRFRAYADLWKWKFGLTVADYRYVVRIANIDMSDLATLTGTQANTAATSLTKLMVKAMARIPSMNAGRAVFLANRTVKEMLSVAALDRSQNALGIVPAINQFGNVAPGSVAGQGTAISGGTVGLLGVPILTVDRILGTEARVV